MPIVIQYDDGLYNYGDGYPVPLSEADQYDTEEAAWAKADECMGATVVYVTSLSKKRLQFALYRTK